MRKHLLAAAFAAAFPFAASAASAQDAGPPPPPPAPVDTAAPAPADVPAPGEKASPDGSKIFGFEPYFGVLGGYESFDNQKSDSGLPRALNANGTIRNNYRLAGGLAEGVIGANLPLGGYFVGVEGNVTKGFTGNIDWEYGGAVRGGFRAGDSGLIYGRVGYQWVNFDHLAPRSTGSTNRDYHDWQYGFGFEAGPKDIGLAGLTGRAGVRLRGEVTTFGNFRNVRPMLGFVTHF